MTSKPTPEFRAEAMRAALTSGPSRKQVAADFGIHCPAGDLQRKSAERGLFDTVSLDPAGSAQSGEACLKATTDSNHSFSIAPNLLNRNLYADHPNQEWAGDISCVRTQEGWLYPAVIICEASC